MVADVAVRPRARLVSWARDLIRPGPRYKVLWGGRGSGKTHQMAGALVLMGAERPLRIACVRETQKSIAESCKQTLEEWIRELGWDGSRYSIGRDSIDGKNGTHFFFRGLHTSTQQTIKGWESVDICWVEEAQRMTARSRELLYPTIRKSGSELWFSFNPVNRHDPVYMDFVARKNPYAWVRRVCWDENPYFPDVLEIERRACLEYEPERYPHIWLGEPDDEGAERQVLPYAMLRACVEYCRGDVDGRLHAGLDIADSGSAKNALVIRRGPTIVYGVQWSARTLGHTVRRADALCREWGIETLYYDAGGVGAGARSYFAEMSQRPYAAHGVNFGEAVAGGQIEYARGQKNQDFFARRNAQLGWALRLRAQSTQRLSDGGIVEPRQCLFIAPDMPQREMYMAQLSQPQWEEQLSGRIAVEKCPDDAPSPDLYDATALAFAHDSRYGLKARRS